ncbi:MAG: hypothetical protein EBR82_73595 [Caulobacteraceae bacterium]|nr:hypothetical protein [Caulobacteraceae bacterium]
MAYIALLDSNNIVTEVYAIPDNVTEERVTEVTGQNCKRTSYNTLGGVHMLGGCGYTYDETRDAFIPPRPTDNAILNEDTCLWELVE